MVSLSWYYIWSAGVSLVLQVKGYDSQQIERKVEIVSETERKRDID